MRHDTAQVAFARAMVVAVRVAGAPAGVGVHRPVGAMSEPAAVGTAPAFRRRGSAEAVMRLPVAESCRRRVRTAFLSAAGDIVARGYAHIGLWLIATACIAEPGLKDERCTK